MRCVFCTMNKEQIVGSNTLAYVVRDTSPVTPLHTLILPKRHLADYFDLDADEKRAIDDLLEESRMGILACDPTVGGFNIGVNVGVVAGQTIFHCHVHLIPRRPGDVANPRGGVRAVIPGKADYGERPGSAVKRGTAMWKVPE
jgi:ATP adenylyltransferase